MSKTKEPLGSIERNFRYGIICATIAGGIMIASLIITGILITNNVVTIYFIPWVLAFDAVTFIVAILIAVAGPGEVTETTLASHKEV